MIENSPCARGTVYTGDVVVCPPGMAQRENGGCYFGCRQSSVMETVNIIDCAVSRFGATIMSQCWRLGRIQPRSQKANDRKVVYASSPPSLEMNQPASEQEMGGPIITPASRRSAHVIKGITGRAVTSSSSEQWSVGREINKHLQHDWRTGTESADCRLNAVRERL